MSDATHAEALAVVVVNPEARIWEGQAESVSSENSAGPFDILPEHANFVTIIKNKPIIVRTGSGENKTFNYKNAVIVVKDDTVKIFSEI